MAYLQHYGTPRHSGRYPWGSGEDPQRSKSFATRVSELKKQGMSEPEIAESFGFKNTTELRAKIHMESEARYGAQVAMASRLRAKGYSDVAISKRMDVSPNTIKNLLLSDTQERHKMTAATREMLKTQADKKGMIDVGTASNLLIGVTKTKMDVSIAELEQKGYVVTSIQTPQLGTTNKTTVRVLLSPDTMKKAAAEYVVKDPAKWKQLSPEERQNKIAYLYASKHSENIQLITDWSSDGGITYKSVKPPVSIDSKRIMVRFDDDIPSGTNMDGVIQIRRGVPDLALPPDKHYGQVRIAVDGTHYMKGMAIYSYDKMPDGIDVIYNSNKNSSVGKLGAMKKMNKEVDTDDGGSIFIDKDGKQKINEFGATIRQSTYIDKAGKEQQSALNIVGFTGKKDSGVEGGWETWSKTLASQFLSKQSPELAKQQLNLAYLDQKDTFDSYMRITQPAVKQRLLDSFADDCDSKAVHLKAAAMPRQTSNVLIPITSLNDDECYSPNYRDGEQLALIRYPHAGTFEIPIVTNNLRNKEAKSILGNGTDAIGITSKTAEKLSGADFDGDTAIALPYNPKTIKVTSLKSLENFNPSKAYPKYEGMPVISAKVKQQEMGKISNLITDMTVKGAPPEEVARAVKHSMVVIDAEKHELNYKQSYIDNGIAELKAKYQGGTLTNPHGASTLISRASSEQRVDKRKALTKEQALATGRTLVRKGQYSVDVKTGEKVYAPTNDGYFNKKGVFVKTQTKSTKMFETSDARDLMSKTPARIEMIYADYANSMKALGNQARKESASIQMTPYSPSAKKVYASEVESLNRKLKVALANAPLERQVHLVGNKIVQARREANPDMDGSQVKKLKGQVLAETRARVGASKTRVEITQREWEAIESGAISNALLKQILDNTNLDIVQSYATPRSKTLMSASKIARAKIYESQGRSLSEIADALGVSVSTLSRALKGEGS